MEKSGEATYHLVVDYGRTRWFIAQDYLLFPEEEPVSPFTELRPPRQPADRVRDIVSPRETTIGFASPWLWFGPVTLEGGLAALERPLEQTPFSGSWAAESGTALSVGRDPPSRLGVGGALGPASLHHLRSEELRRTVAVLGAGAPRESGLWGELIVSQDVSLSEPDPADEPWFLAEPPRLAEEGFHGALRGGFNGGAVEQRLLLGASGTRLDPPGFSAVSATRLAQGPWGVSFAWLDSGYRDGALELRSPGLSAVLMRKPGVRRGHTLGGSVSGKRTGASGAGDGGELATAAELNWRWRPGPWERAEVRWSADVSAKQEKSFVEGERSLKIEAAGRPELRLRGRRKARSVRLLAPTGVGQEREPGESPVTTVNFGLDVTVRLGQLRVNPSWSVEREIGEEREHSPKLSILLNWSGKYRAQLGLRAGVSKSLSWEDLTSLSIYDEQVEGALFLRLSG